MMEHVEHEYSSLDEMERALLDEERAHKRAKYLDVATLIGALIGVLAIVTLCGCVVSTPSQPGPQQEQNVGIGIGIGIPAPTPIPTPTPTPSPTPAVG